jgi:hypothetical protein
MGNLRELLRPPSVRRVGKIVSRRRIVYQADFIRLDFVATISEKQVKTPMCLVV